MNQNVIHNTAYNYLSSYKLSMEHFEDFVNGHPTAG